jgi:hypothetical protein
MFIATILCDKSLSGLSHYNLDIHVLLSVRECDRNHAAGDPGHIDILAVDGHGNDPLFHMVRVLDGHVVSRTAEISSGGKAIQRGRNTRIDHQSVIIRADAQNVLGDVKERPCSRSGQPAVLGLTEILGIFAGDHL